LREIKFRAWDKRNKKMSKPYILKGEGYEEFDFGKGCILIQYTGVKDKNGKEIYEGDIVKSPTFISEVIWKKDSGCFLYKTNNKTFEGFAMGYEWVEIIGNIYENPELIKSQD